MANSDYQLDPRFIGGCKMIERLKGRQALQIRYSDDEEPTVWFMVAGFEHSSGHTVYEVGASLDPVRAMMRLLERLIDGAECAHCHRATVFFEEPLEAEDPGWCTYAWDPELSKFRRSCEGD